MNKTSFFVMAFILAFSPRTEAARPDCATSESLPDGFIKFVEFAGYAKFLMVPNDWIVEKYDGVGFKQLVVGGPGLGTITITRFETQSQSLRAWAKDYASLMDSEYPGERHKPKKVSACIAGWDTKYYEFFATGIDGIPGTDKIEIHTFDLDGKQLFVVLIADKDRKEVWKRMRAILRFSKMSKGAA